MRRLKHLGKGLGMCLLLAGAPAWADPAHQPAPPADAPKQSLPFQLVNQFRTMFGVHPGFRANHAKGALFEGTFTPTAAAKDLSKAEHLQGPTVAIIFRFS